MIEKPDKSAFMKIFQCLWTLHIFTLEECSDNVIFSEWSNQALDSRSFRKYIGYDNLLFLENVWNLIEIP